VGVVKPRCAPQQHSQWTPAEHGLDGQHCAACWYNL
jgi:hypothetical protein